MFSIATLQQEFVLSSTCTEYLLVSRLIYLLFSYRQISLAINFSANGASHASLDLSVKYMSCHVVLYLFECSITFSQEVQVIWARNWTVTTWLYVFTRYRTLSICIFILLPIWGHEVCNLYNSFLTIYKLTYLTMFRRSKTT